MPRPPAPAACPPRPARAQQAGLGGVLVPRSAIQRLSDVQQGYMADYKELRAKAESVRRLAKRRVALWRQVEALRRQRGHDGSGGPRETLEEKQQEFHDVQLRKDKLEAQTHALADIAAQLQAELKHLVMSDEAERLQRAQEERREAQARRLRDERAEEERRLRTQDEYKDWRRQKELEEQEAKSRLKHEEAMRELAVEEAHKSLREQEARGKLELEEERLRLQHEDALRRLQVEEAKQQMDTDSKLAVEEAQTNMRQQEARGKLELEEERIRLQHEEALRKLEVEDARLRMDEEVWRRKEEAEARRARGDEPPAPASPPEPPLASPPLPPPARPPPAAPPAAPPPGPVLGPSADSFTVVAEARVEALGFELARAPPERAVVKFVEPGSWAEVYGQMKIGDELVSIDGLSCAQLTMTEFLAAVARRPLWLTLARGGADPDGAERLEPAEGDILLLAAGRRVEQLSCSLRGQPPDVVQLSELDAAGWAARSTRLRVGDQLLAIGGLPVPTIDPQDFSGLLRQRPLHLALARGPGYLPGAGPSGQASGAAGAEGAAAGRRVLHVVATAKVETLGCDLAGGGAQPVVVTKLAPWSWAEWELVVGDQLLEINGRSVAGRPLQEWASELKSRPVTLTLLREGSVGGSPTASQDASRKSSAASLLPPFKAATGGPLGSLYQVVADADVQQLGCTFPVFPLETAALSASPLGAVTVLAVKAGSWAAGSGVAVGDKLLEIDGNEVCDMSALEFNQLVQETRPLELRLYRPSAGGALQPADGPVAVEAEAPGPGSLARVARAKGLPIFRQQVKRLIRGKKRMLEKPVIKCTKESADASVNWLLRTAAEDPQLVGPFRALRQLLKEFLPSVAGRSQTEAYDMIEGISMTQEAELEKLEKALVQTEADLSVMEAQAWVGNVLASAVEMMLAGQFGPHLLDT